MRLLKSIFAQLFSKPSRIPGGVDDSYRSVRMEEAVALIKKGYSLYQSKNFSEARSVFNQTLQIDPNNSDALCMLGEINFSEKNYDDAVKSYSAALQIKSDIPEACYALANIFYLSENYEKAIAHIEAALRNQPDWPEAYNKYGIILKATRNLKGAKEKFEKAVALNKNFAQGYYNLGIVTAEMDDLQNAVNYFTEAIRVKPGFSLAHSGRARCLLLRGEVSRASTDFEKAVQIDNKSPTILTEWAELLRYEGRIKESIECLEKAVSLNPASVGIYQNLLLSILYDPDRDNKDLFAAHKKFEKQHAETIYADFQYKKYTNSVNPEKKLRIGYLSSDFRDHPVGYNIKPLFEGCDHDRFEVYCYSNVRHPTALTNWFEKAADKWQFIGGMGDKKVAELIHNDRVDIFVSLAGRFDNNRPLIATYKPAPVQISFHDPATSGLKAMDYLITDRVMNPCNTTEQFTERLIHLPSFYLHGDIGDQVAVSELPALSNGFITFGSMNNPSKINSQVIELWALALQAVPQSKIFLKYKNFYSDSGVREDFIYRFSAHGVDQDRILFNAGLDNRETHLNLYSQVDISLDTFPFTGSTTTFESLVMGVPVITLAGDRMVARWSASMLKCLGMDEWIANTKSEFIDIAKEWSLKISDLKKIRQSLRNSVIKSPICDARLKVRHIERAYRYMWRKWCADQIN